MRGSPLQFQLSTILLLTVLAAFGLAWYLEVVRHQREIVGLWKYPPMSNAHGAYAATLELRGDGTFSRTDYRRIETSYGGTYAWQDDGCVLFLAKQRQFFIRCKVDNVGRLVLVEDELRSDYDFDTRWTGTYLPMTKP